MLIDVVYMLVSKNGDAVVYAAPGATAKEAWDNAMASEFGECFPSREQVRKRGWRAKKVEIRLADEDSDWRLLEEREYQGR